MSASTTDDADDYDDGMVRLEFNLSAPLGLELAKGSTLVQAVVAAGQGDIAGVPLGSYLVGVGEYSVGTPAETAAAIGRLRAAGFFTAMFTFDIGGENPLQREVFQHAQEATQAVSAPPGWLSAPPSPPPPPPALHGSSGDANASVERNKPLKSRSWWQVLVGSGKGKNEKCARKPSEYRERIMAFYEHYGMPGKAAKVDEYLEKYKGKEEGMITVLVNKYGPEPPPKRPAQHASRAAASQAPLASTGGQKVTTTRAAQPAKAEATSQLAKASTSVEARSTQLSPQPPLAPHPAKVPPGSVRPPVVSSNSKEQIRAMLATRRNSKRDEEELSRLEATCVGGEAWSDISRVSSDDHNAGYFDPGVFEGVSSAGASRGAEVAVPASSSLMQGRVEQRQQQQISTQPHRHPSLSAPLDQPTNSSDGKGNAAPPKERASAAAPAPPPDEGFSWTANTALPSAFGFGVEAGLGALQATSAGLSAATSWAAKAAPDIEIERGFRALSFVTRVGSAL